MSVSLCLAQEQIKSYHHQGCHGSCDHKSSASEMSNERRLKHWRFYPARGGGIDQQPFTCHSSFTHAAPSPTRLMAGKCKTFTRHVIIHVNCVNNGFLSSVTSRLVVWLPRYYNVIDYFVTVRQYTYTWGLNNLIKNIEIKYGV